MQSKFWGRKVEAADVINSRPCVDPQCHGCSFNHRSATTITRADLAILSMANITSRLPMATSMFAIDA